MPTIFSARATSLTSGSPTEMSPPAVWICGSETPSWSTRWRMMSTARWSASWVTTGVCAVGLPWYTSSTPPFRSSPRTVFCVAIATADAISSPSDEEQDEAVALAIAHRA